MPKEKSDSEEVDETYYPHLKREINFHMVCDTSIYKSVQQIHPLLHQHFSIDHVLGLYEPILYVSDFWHMQRDLIMLEEESIDRIHKVRAGEVQEGEEGAEEFQIKKLNFDGNVKFTFDNYYINYLSYQEQFRGSLRQN